MVRKPEGSLMRCCVVGYRFDNKFGSIVFLRILKNVEVCTGLDWRIVYRNLRVVFEGPGELEFKNH